MDEDFRPWMAACPALCLVWVNLPVVVREGGRGGIDRGMDYANAGDWSEIFVLQ